MTANLSTVRKFVFQCECQHKHRFTSAEKSAGEGVVCQDDAPYRYVGSLTPDEGEGDRHLHYRALLTKFETVH